MSHYDRKEKRTLFVYISIFFLLVVGIAVGGYVSYRNFEQEFRRQAEHQISAIAELKVNELVNWRKERLGDAEFIYHNPAFSVLVERYFESPDDVEARTQLLAWLGNYQVYGQYDRVRLLDVTSAERLSIPTAPDTVDAHLVIDATASLRSGKVTFLDFTRDTSAGGEIRISIFVPIFADQNNNHPLGVLALRIDPETYLYPYIQSWPTNSTSAETLLVRREGDEALFLNELRFGQDAALTLRYPLTDTEIPAVKAVLGQTGVVEGVDYHGESVLADVRAVPDSPWFLVSKMDTAEVYAPLRARLWGTLGLIGMAIFVAGAGLALVWRQGRIRFYRAQAEAAVVLRESEEKMRSIFRVAPTGIGIVSNRILLEVNPRICEMTGYAKEELIGQSARILYPTQVEFELVGKEKYQQIAQIGSGVVETRWQKKDGSIINIILASTPIDPADLSRGVTFTALDITDRKQAEEALHNNEEKYRRLFDNAPLGIFQSTPDGKVISINPAFAHMLGYNSSEDALKSIKNVATELFADPNRRAEIMRLMAENPNLRTFENVYRRKDGSTFIGNLNTIPIRDFDGRLLRVEGIVEDITERKRAEEALYASEERYRTLIEQIPAVVYIDHATGDPGHSLYVSPQIEMLLGVTPDEWLQEDLDLWANHIHPDDRTHAKAEYLRGFQSGEKINCEYRMITTDGRLVWIRDQTTTIHDVYGRPSLIQGVMYDITERKQAEDEIHKLNAELEQRVRDRTLQLETANKELEAFSYSVSHDLRAPLRGIDGWSQALLEDYRDKLDEQGQQYIERVRSETQRMGHLIEDMLQLSRLTRAEIHKEQVDLSALAQAIAEHLQAAEPLRKVDFNIQAGLTAEGDSHLLEAVLTNLLGNALKFTGKRADAHIEFGQTESQGQRVFFIRDNGAGFDMAYSQKLFGAFQRMHKVSEFPGTGIGLATVQRIIHRHGGRVWAEAELERGATFYFTFEPSSPLLPQQR